jgi:pimeloyl-ACP methyl ester carboxylesterase
MRDAILRDWPLFAARSARAIVSQPASEETLGWLARIFCATPLQSALAGLEMLRQFEPLQLEKRWDVPVVFVHGTDDPIVPASVSRDCAAHFGAVAAEVTSSGHLVLIDQPRALENIVIRALTAVR